MKFFPRKRKTDIPALSRIAAVPSCVYIFMIILLTVIFCSCAYAADGAEDASSGRGKTVNLLVLGTDLPLEGTKDAGRSDSINLFSVSLDSAVIRCITFERSIPVYVPEIYEKDMLTNVYHWAGA